MGADIHLVLQVFDKASSRYLFIYSVNGVIKLSENHPRCEVDDVEADEQPIYTDDVYDMNIVRDYILFSKVANVRNEYGLRDVLEPRGLPEDLKGSTMEKWLSRNTWASPITHLYASDIDKLSLDECPVSKFHFFVPVMVHEKFMRECNRKIHINSYFSQFIYQGYEPRCTACGTIYSFEEWEKFTMKQRLDKMQGRHEYVFIEIASIYKRDAGGVEALKSLGEEIKKSYPDYRFIVYFDDA